MTKQRKIYHAISATLVLISLLFMLFAYPHCIRRFVEGIRDLFMSIGHYGAQIFDLEFKWELKFNSLPDKFYSSYLPFDIEEIQRKLSAFFPALFRKDSFMLYLVWLINGTKMWSKLLLILLPLLLLLPRLLMSLILAHNNRYNEDTKPLQFWKEHIEKYLRIAIAETKKYLSYLLGNKWYRLSLLLIWGINLNMLSIVMGVVTYYLYFVVTLNLLTLPIQAVRLICDVLIMFACGNLVFWLVLAYIILDKIRRNIGYNRLDHNENINRGFIKERPIFNMVCGLVGKFKTKLCVDMGISQSIMFRGDALDALQENEMKFPHFPWIMLEREFERAVEYGQIKDVYTCRAWLKKKKQRFEKSPSIERIYGYDYTRYSMFWDSGLKLENIFEVIGFYTELYMIYIMDSSLMIANFAIRDDTYIYDEGNFPLWNTELFRRPSSMLEETSHYAHILNYDSVRLGKKLMDENKNMLARVGVYIMTEIGKERGNKVELEGKKKNSEEANQKNDLFDYWLKLIRHLVTIYYTPYAKIFTDEQRPDSLGANTRQLGDIIWVDERSQLFIVMPFFLLEDMIYDFIYIPYMKKLNLPYRVKRGDNTLFIYLVKGVMAKFFNHYKKVYGIYGTYEMKLVVQSGRMESKGKKYVYYISTKKDHSDRYSTDCYSDVFDEVSSRFPYWINDIPTYESVRATYEEMLGQESYMFNDIVDFTDVRK